MHNFLSLLGVLLLAIAGEIQQRCQDAARLALSLCGTAARLAYSLCWDLCYAAVVAVPCGLAIGACDLMRHWAINGGCWAYAMLHATFDLALDKVYGLLSGISYVAIAYCLAGFPAALAIAVCELGRFASGVKARFDLHSRVAFLCDAFAQVAIDVDCLSGMRVLDENNHQLAAQRARREADMAAAECHDRRQAEVMASLDRIQAAEKQAA